MLLLPALKVFLQPVTWQTMFIARRLPPLALAAWPHWTQKNIWNRRVDRPACRFCQGASNMRLRTPVLASALLERLQPRPIAELLLQGRSLFATEVALQSPTAMRQVFLRPAAVRTGNASVHRAGRW